MRHKDLIVAFDFDNTVFDYHKLGRSFPYVRALLKRCKKLNLTLVLFTVEDDEEKLQLKKDYCNSYGFYPDYVNESPVYPEAKKPYYNILLDDRAGLGDAAAALNSALNFIEEHEDSRTETA